MSQYEGGKHMDDEKVKNDIVYFSEYILGFKLQEWQKDLLIKYKQGEIIWFGHRNGKNMVKETIREHQKLMSQSN